MSVADTSDVFIQKFFSRIPKETAPTFTEAQLAAVKMAFGGRDWGAHAIDIRRSMPVPFGRRAYLVLLMGWEQRTSTRIWTLHRDHPLLQTGNAILMTILFVTLLMSVLGVLYALKMALGIDIVPGVDMLPDEELKRLIR